MAAGPIGLGASPAPSCPSKPFFEPEALTAGAGTRHVGVKEVDGKSYEVVRFTAMQPPEGLTRYYFGERGLLEGMEIDFNEGDRAGTFRLWLKSLRLNTPLTANDRELRDALVKAGVE
jgi:hypothetical protein